VTFSGSPMFHGTLMEPKSFHGTFLVSWDITPWTFASKLHLIKLSTLILCRLPFAKYLWNRKEKSTLFCFSTSPPYAIHNNTVYHHHYVYAWKVMVILSTLQYNSATNQFEGTSCVQQLLQFNNKMQLVKDI